VAEARVGSRILRVGDVVRIEGERGTFEVFGFRVEQGAIACARVFGGAAGRHHWRYFRLERIGARKRTPKEEA